MTPTESGTSRELPRYRSHKEVWALKIKGIDLYGVDGATIRSEDAGYGPLRVTAAYIDKHDPQPGGYYVLYKDGYESFSPAAAFEEGYTKVG